MGASGWTYFVPYQPDINKALQELREEVFKKGKYHNCVEYELNQIQEYGYDPYTTHPRYAVTEAEVEHWLSTTQARTMEDLIKIQSDTGTHSIIDIDEISDVTGFRTATPLTQQEALELFGTKHPTKSMVLEAEMQLMSMRGRWSATYVVVYQDGQPSEICFTGFSGD